MTRFKRKEVHPQILRSYLDVKHARWFDEYYPFIMLGSMLGAIATVGLMFVIQPSPMIGALMALGGLFIILLPYAAMIFLSPGRHRKNVLGLFVAFIALTVVCFWLLSVLDAHGWLGL